MVMRLGFNNAGAFHARTGYRQPGEGPRAVLIRGSIRSKSTSHHGVKCVFSQVIV